MAVSLWQRGRKDQLAMAALLFALLTVATGRDDVWAQVLRLEESSSRLLVLLATRAIAGRQMLLLVPLALTLPRIIAGTGASVSRYLSRTVAEWVGDEGIPCPATAPALGEPPAEPDTCCNARFWSEMRRSVAPAPLHCTSELASLSDSHLCYIQPLPVFMLTMTPDTK